MNYTKYFLTFSIILNLVLIGFIIGNKFNTNFLKKDKFTNNKIVKLISKTELTEDKKEEFIERIKNLKISKNQKREVRKLWRNKIKKIIEADEFDEDALKVLLEKRASIFADNRGEAIDTIIDLLNTLSKKDRIRISKLILKTDRT